MDGDQIIFREILEVSIKTADAEMTLDYALFVFKFYKQEAEQYMNGTLQDCKLKNFFDKALAVFRDHAVDIRAAQKILKSFRDEALILLIKGPTDVA